MRLLNRVLTVLIACGVAAAGVVCVQRLGAERRSGAVEIVVDYPEAVALAAASGEDVVTILRALKAAGATGVAIYESSLQDLLAEGRVRLAPPTGADVPSGTVVVDARELSAQVTAHVRAKVGPCEIMLRNPDLVRIPARALTIPNLTVGYDPGTVMQVLQSDLTVIARPSVAEVRTRAALQLAVDEAAATGAQQVVFAGPAVLGYRELIPEAAEMLSKAGLTYCSVEFGRQLGEGALGRRLKGRLLRLHSINENEMPTMTPPKAVERFVRAVRERNIRVCYVRLFLEAVKQPLEQNKQFISAISGRLSAVGFAVGTARPLEAFGGSAARYLRTIAGVGAAAAGVYLLVFLWQVSVWWGWSLLLIGAALATVGQVAELGNVSKLLALLAAVAMPTLGLATLRLGMEPFAETWSGALGRGLRAFVLCTALSLGGAVLVAGLLGELPFMVGLDQFRGVKIAQFLPLLAAAAIYLGRPPGTGRSHPFGDYVRRWLDALRQAVRYEHAVILVLAVVALALLAIRSGNEPAIGVTGAELRFRSLLERLLVVRPRTKEFLIGHPLLIVGLALAARGQVRGLWWCLALGGIGQVSMVNTFCHLHTPLMVSVMRTGHGLWMGAALGAAATGVWIGWLGPWLQRLGEGGAGRG